MILEKSYFTRKQAREDFDLAERQIKEERRRQAENLEKKHKQNLERMKTDFQKQIGI